jgi:hypothetical protein
VCGRALECTEYYSWEENKFGLNRGNDEEYNWNENWQNGFE